MTTIEWTQRTWNPVRGCSRVSPGCDNCYAMRQAHRFSGPGQPYEGLTTIRRGKVDWTGSVRFVPEMLEVPLHAPMRITGTEAGGAAAWRPFASRLRCCVSGGQAHP